jgi:hypothetical protein
MGNFLDRAKLLQKEEIKILKVDLPSGDFVYVRQMSGRERDQFEQSLLKSVKNAKGETTFEQSLDDFRAKLAVASLCDEQGNYLLVARDIPMLSQNMTATSLDKIVTESQKLNSISETDKENLVKNSVADQVGNSNSVSAEN